MVLTTIRRGRGSAALPSFPPASPARAPALRCPNVDVDVMITGSIYSAAAGDHTPDLVRNDEELGPPPAHGRSKDIDYPMFETDCYGGGN